MRLLLVSDEYEEDCIVLGSISHVEHGLTTGSNSGYYFHGLTPEMRVRISDLIYNNIEVPKPVLQPRGESPIQAAVDFMSKVLPFRMPNG